MSHQTDDIRIGGTRQLIAPVILMQELAITDAVSDLVYETRNDCARIIRGEDDRLVVVAGPCSIHDPAAALEYAKRLRAYAGTARDELLLIMRVYFEKPRTTVGWKGLINDPGLDDSFDINRGLHVARELLLEVNRLGLPAGTEFLDTITPQYIGDLVSWGAIGARTTESQVHRELASGLSAPVGFKNGTDGNIKIAVDAIKAARGPHHFLSVTKSGDSAIVTTTGNADCHVILRGSSRPNYDAESIAHVVAMLESAELPPHLMVDCSHGNSGKDHARQPAVAADLGAQIAAGSRAIAAVMLESNLVEGSQPLNGGKDLVYGQSVTDACMSWETTVGVLDGLREAVRKRRAGRELS